MAVGFNINKRKPAAKAELAQIRKMLIAKRAERDTVNGKKLELSDSRKGAITRRLNDNTKSTSRISDSGSPDDTGGSEDFGGDTGVTGGQP